MVTTRRGSTTERQQPAEEKESEKAEPATTTEKKHKHTEPTAEEKKEEPEKKKSKTTTSTTPKKGKGRRKSGEHGEKEKEGKAGPEAEEKNVKHEEGTEAKEKEGKAGPEAEEKNVKHEEGTEAKERGRELEAEKSPILEKGIVYFFLRGKVNVEHPESLDEVKRSYMVLRPLQPGEKLVEGKLSHPGVYRLLAIPKKRLPSKGYEKFLTFVEEPAATLDVIKEKHLKGRHYHGKTVGERTDFPAEPIGEGVYAICHSGDERQSHFVYMLTIPETPNELQRDFGLKEKGSFVISVRNPDYPPLPGQGPQLKAEFPKQIMEQFRNLRWAAVRPEHLNYKNAEILFIGENRFPHEGEYKNVEKQLELLEEEDEERVKHLKGTESIFDDLELSKKEFMGLQTTWK